MMKNDIAINNSYEDINKAATALVPVFEMNEWTWVCVGIPKWSNLMDTFHMLEYKARKRARENENGMSIVSTGRLSVFVKLSTDVVLYGLTKLMEKEISNYGYNRKDL